MPAGPIPIGRPFANTLVYVLRQGLCARFPLGMPGELHIGGGRCCQGIPEQSVVDTGTIRKKSVFRSSSGERLYKTGDLVKFIADGNIQYMARMDHQVKIRGFRIEPGEIEACFLAQPHYPGDAAVIAVNGQGRDMRLRAFVALEHRADEFKTRDLPGYLKTHLPPHMIPHEIRILSNLPRLASGKIDKKALEQIESPAAVSTAHAAGGPD